MALHHASVVVMASAGRRSPGLDADARLLNEGIRLSAITVWLEMAEAVAALGRDQAARLRGLFRGLDPQIGFFGALGRRAGGRSAVEAVVEC